jgi:hypothetical protein
VRQDKHSAGPFLHRIQGDFSYTKAFSGIMMDEKIPINIEMVAVKRKTVKVIFRQLLNGKSRAKDIFLLTAYLFQVGMPFTPAWDNAYISIYMKPEIPASSSGLTR